LRHGCCLIRGDRGRERETETIFIGRLAKKFSSNKKVSKQSR
jgi:hypothetical protein